MPLASRGQPRINIRAVPVTGAIAHAFKTGDLARGTEISAADLTALGQKELSALASTQIAVFGAQSPRGARFRKQLTRIPTLGQRGSCTSFGNGSTPTAIATAAAAGWSLVKPIRLTSIRSTPKSKSVGVTLSNGLIYVQSVPVGDLTAEVVTALGIILPTAFASAEKAKAVRGCNNLRPARVTKIDSTTGVSITLPCSHNKLDTAAEIEFYESSAERASVA